MRRPPWSTATRPALGRGTQKMALPRATTAHGTAGWHTCSPGRAASTCCSEPCCLLRPFRTTRSTLVKIQMWSALRRRKISYTNQLQPDLERNQNMEKNKGEGRRGYNILCHWLYFLILFCFLAHTTLSLEENLRVSADSERIKTPCTSALILTLISITTLFSVP